MTGISNVAGKITARLKETNIFSKNPKSVTMRFVKNVSSTLQNILDVQWINQRTK